MIGLALALIVVAYAIGFGRRAKEGRA